jgi:hemolysin activation/secretion protein
MKRAPRKDSAPRKALGLCLVVLCLATGLAPVFGEESAQQEPSRAEEAGPVFPVNAYRVSGNTVLDDDTVGRALFPFTGPSKTAKNVEEARTALEKLHHDRGYPTVLVNIPEQEIEDGIVRLEVIEGKTGKVRVTGNRYFTTKKILKDLPSFREGGLLHLPSVRSELLKANSHPDMSVSPVMIPGRDPGTVDIELKVKDRLPLHVTQEFSNRAAHDTTLLRSNTRIRYDNLWQAGHGCAFQWQSSPGDMEEVQVLALSYVMPAPWNADHTLAAYTVWSDSETAFGEGFRVVGEGWLSGVRLVVPMPASDTASRSVTLGFDYKDLEEVSGYAGGADAVSTPVTYMPVSVAYSAAHQAGRGETRFNLGASLGIRDVLVKSEEFLDKRYKARGNYLITTMGVERTQTLPGGASFFLKLDGQAANQPLVANEQYAAGGMESVRGYKESEETGDMAFHTVFELLAPDLGAWLPGKAKGRTRFLPYSFWEYAELHQRSPLPGQDETAVLQGWGLGLRGSVLKNLDFQADWAQALTDTSHTRAGDWRWHARVRIRF